MAELCAHTEQMNSKIICESVITNLELLLQDTENRFEACTSDVGRNTFYSELPEVIISHSGRITKGLLDALFAFEYDKDIIVEIWRNVFDIMKLRFPNLDQYTSDNIFEETDELLELRNCLLMRFIDGGKESFLATC